MHCEITDPAAVWPQQTHRLVNNDGFIGKQFTYTSKARLNVQLINHPNTSAEKPKVRSTNTGSPLGALKTGSFALVQGLLSYSIVYYILPACTVLCFAGLLCSKNLMFPLSLHVTIKHSTLLTLQ